MRGGGRLLLTTIPAVGEELTVAGTEHHHLVRVVRCKPGDLVEILDGKGLRAQARVDSIGRRDARLNILERSQEPAPEVLELALPLLKKTTLDGVLRRAVELGATRIALLVTEHTHQAKPKPDQMERLNRIMEEASKQCGRAWVPELVPPIEFEQYLENADQGGVFLDQKGRGPKEVMSELDQAPGSWLVGPEGDLSEREKLGLKAAGWRGLKLDRHTLRSGTAALAALVLAQHWRQIWTA